MDLAPARRRGARVASWNQAAVGATVLVLLGVLHAPTLRELWTTWTTNDNYSHGPLVPLVALGMVWLRRATLRSLPIVPDTRGLIVVAAGCLLFVAGLRADVFTLRGYALLVTLVGLSLTFLGTRWTKALAFPFAYLIFMLPFPPIVVNRLSYALKEVAVRLSTGAAEGLGATLQRSGMTLYLSSGELRIENPCSGLRSLLALLATGAAFGALQPGAWWRRVLLVAATVPIALFANAVRITMLIVVAHYVGVPATIGTLHDVSGYVLYAVALGGLFAARLLLKPRAADTPRPVLSVRGVPA